MMSSILLIGCCIILLLLAVLGAGEFADVYFIYGQTDEALNATAIGNITTSMKVERIDILLKADLTASLAGLALAAAAFLYGYRMPELQSSNEAIALRDSRNRENLNQAKKHLIYAFFFLLVCTLSIFGFDLVEQGTTEQSELTFDIDTADVISKYGLFFAGLYFLAKGAWKLYKSLIGGSAVFKDVDQDPNSDSARVLATIKSATNGIRTKEIAIKLHMDENDVKMIVNRLEKTYKVRKEGSITHKYYFMT